jgi:hypothetical protein
MEDVLEVYTRADDPRRPLVCMDETSTQLLRDTRAGQPPAPGRPALPCVDYEYEREAVVNLLLCCEPLAGRRWVEVTAQRTRRDWALQIQPLVDVRYPDAARLVLVLDNLNVHTPGALYDTVPTVQPSQAKRLADKLELHDTPKHGSWLTIAEIELSVLSRQCLDRRVPDAATLVHAVAACQDRRNAAATPVDWRFTTADARIKLTRLSPSLQE